MELQKLQKRKKKATEDVNHSQLAQACKNLGDYYTQEGDYKKALKEYRQEADIHNRSKNKLKHAVANRWIGESYMALEEFDEALKHVETYLKISLELEDKIEAERAYTSLGRVYLAIGQTEDGHTKVTSSVSTQKALKQAEKCFIKGVLMCKDLVGLVTNHELTDMKARLYLNLSLTKENAGEMDKALEYMTKAIALCKCGELYEILHKCYMAMSTQYVKLSDTQNGLRYINLASDVAERLSNRVAKCCETWIAYAAILIRSGDYQSAKQVLMKAYKLKSPIEADRQSVESSLRTVAALCKTEDDLIVVYAGDYKRRRELYEKMGDGSCALGNYEKAAIYYEHALENAKQNKDKGSLLIPIYVSLYETYRDMKSYKKALQYMWEEFELCKEGNAKEAVYTLLSIAEVTVLSGDSTSVTEGVLKQAMKSAKVTGDVDVQVKVLLKLLELYTKSGDADKLSVLEEGDLRVMGMTLSSLDEHGLRLKEEEDLAEDDDKADTPNIGEEISLDDLSNSESEPDVDEEETKETKRTSMRKRTAISNKIKRNAKGETELHTACIAGNVASVKRLLNAGHPLNVRDNAGWLPLHEAANHGFYEVVALLVESGGGAAMINDRGDSSCEGITPLHDACSNGHLEIVELLLDKGANPTIRTDAGETPLDFLVIWRGTEGGELDPVRDSFYETLRIRLVEAAKKVCLSSRGQQQQQSRKPVIQSKSLRRQCSNKENNTKIGNLRMGIVDDEDESSNDSIAEQTRTRSPMTSAAVKRKKTEATAMYKSAISNLRNNNHGLETSVDVNDDNMDVDGQKKRTAYLDSQELELDDWLEEDVVVMQEKKRRRFMTEDSIPRKPATVSLSLTKKDVKRSLERTPQKVVVVDLVAEPVVAAEVSHMNSNNSGSDAFDLIMKSKQGQGKSSSRSNSSRRRPSQGSATSRNQSSAIQAGFSRSHFDENDDEDSNDVQDSGIASPVKSSRSSSTVNNTSISGVATSGFVTMKVKIEDQLIVVPVKAVDAGNYTMKWLAENAAKRYENIHGRLPFLSLCTTDGAIFDENDPLEIVMDTKPYISTQVKRWTQKSLSDSYVACCAITRQDVNNSILSRLQSSDDQKVVDMSQLNLSAADLESLLKCLQCNTDIVRLDLSSNLIDDQGVIHVCQTVASLPQLRLLNLAGNLITVDGVMKMENQFAGSRMHLPELTALDLSFNKITDSALRSVSGMCSTLPKLAKLSLKSCHLTTLESLSTPLGQLVSLDLSHNSFKNLKSLWSNLRVDKIRELNLDLAVANNYTEFARELIAWLKADNSLGIVQLESLSLANCSLTDSLVWELMQAMKPSSQLKQLSLMNNPNLSSLSLKTILKSSLPLEAVNLRGCHQIANDLKGNELNDCVSGLDITNLPQKLIVSITGVEDKSSLAGSFKDLWISQFGNEQVRLEQSEHTLIISCSPEE